MSHAKKAKNFLFCKKKFRGSKKFKITSKLFQKTKKKYPSLQEVLNKKKLFHINNIKPAFKTLNRMDSFLV